MELLDREFQRALLQRMAERFPDEVEPLHELDGMDPRQITYNLAYLREHGLVRVQWQNGSREAIPVRAAITAQGIDFITDDGGLSAILGVVTIRLHQDEVKDLLIQKINSAKAPEGVKTALVAQVKKLPAEMVKQATMEGLKAGLDSVPDLILWLRTQLGL